MLVANAKEEKPVRRMECTIGQWVWRDGSETVINHFRIVSLSILSGNYKIIQNMKRREVESLFAFIMCEKLTL